MWIEFGGRLLNLNLIGYFQAETCAGTWRVAAYSIDSKLIASEDFGKAEAMARARLQIIKSKLNG